MAGINRATFITEEEDRTLSQIAAERKWSVSQTIAELVRQSPIFCAAMASRRDAVGDEQPRAEQVA